jgi:hypothetical protein
MTTEELWQSQAVNAPRITLAYLRGRADDSIRKTRRWNLVEYSSSMFGVVAALFIWLTHADAWMRAGAVLLVVASVIYAWRWRVVAAPEAAPADLGALDTLRFHRRGLERQHAAYRGSWRWVVPLFFPPVASIWYGGLLLSDAAGMKLAFMIAVPLAGFALGVGITESRAAKLRREIELLDLMAK